MLKLNKLILMIALLTGNCILISSEQVSRVPAMTVVNLPKKVFDKVYYQPFFLALFELATTRITFGDHYTQYHIAELDLHVSKGINPKTGEPIYTACQNKDRLISADRIYRASEGIFAFKSEKIATQGLMEMSGQKLTVDFSELETFWQAIKHL